MKQSTQSMPSVHLIERLRTRAQGISPFRWLLLLWIGCVYLWGILWGGVFKEQITSRAIFLFTLLILLHLILYGIGGFWPASSRGTRLLYFTVQVSLIIAISLIARRFTVTLGLYLALMGEIASLLLDIRVALLVGGACLLLFGLNLGLLYGWRQVPILSQHLVPLHMALLYVLPAFVLIIGYALQQTRAGAHPGPAPRA
jgi:hypothetical protein